MAFHKKGSDPSRELQVEVKSEEDWQNLIQNQGLIVVDAYAEWCGPCKAIVNIFRRIKNELGDDLLNFAIAETDSIESLEKYRGKSEPTFLFYGGGQLVNVSHGCNGPKIIKLIKNQLKKEHQIIEGTAEREIFVDKSIERDQAAAEKGDDEKDVVDEEEEELVEIPKQVAVALIKPDAVQAGLVDQIIEEITSNGLEILCKEERTLTKEEAADFYKQHEGSEHFEQLIQFMSSGPCMTLVVTKSGDDIGEDFLPEFRKLIGPLDVNIAKEEAPESLRAKYGKDTIQNAVHSCDSTESAARELAFFFPDFNAPVVQKTQKKKRLQRTLALIRPNTLKKRKDSILKTIEDSGFLIAMQKEVQLERAQVEELYAEHKDKDYFESLVANMICGPSLALCLAREDAVQVWRDMLGPKDINIPATPTGDAPQTSDETEASGEPKATTEEASEQPKEGEVEEAPTDATATTDVGGGSDGGITSNISLRQRFSDPNDTINPLHGADTEEQANREMNFFFPMQTTVAVIKPDVCEKPDERDAIVNKIKAAGFNISALKEVMLTKELASMFYKEHEGKEFFNNLTDYMASGPTQFLILSREDAVSGFRSLMGPTKPGEAKEVDPNSLRAQFGIDEMKNAIHGSSSLTKAKQVIDEFFPDIKFDEEGKVLQEESAEVEEPVAGDVNANDQKEVSEANGDVKSPEEEVEQNITEGEAEQNTTKETLNATESKEQQETSLETEEPTKENEDVKEKEDPKSEEATSAPTPEAETKTPDVSEDKQEPVEDKSADQTEDKPAHQTESQNKPADWTESQDKPADQTEAQDKPADQTEAQDKPADQTEAQATEEENKD